MSASKRPLWTDETGRDALQWAANQAGAAGRRDWASRLQGLCNQYDDLPDHSNDLSLSDHSNDVTIHGYPPQ